MTLPNLRNITIKPHPTQQIFRKEKVSLAALAQALELSPGYVCSLLTGARPCSPDTDKRLRALAAQLEEEGKG